MYIGPGVWYTIHMLSLSVDNGQFDKCVLTNFIKFLETKLSGGWGKTLENNRLKLLNDKIEIRSYFDWSFLIHEMVNKDLNKPQVSYTNVKNCYTMNVNFNPYPFDDIEYGVEHLTTFLHDIKIFSSEYTILYENLVNLYKSKNPSLYYNQQ